MAAQPIPAPAEYASEITAQRSLNVKRAAGIVRWTVTEFNHGDSFILNADSGSTQYTAHFDAEQWAAFQRLILPLVGVSS